MDGKPVLSLDFGYSSSVTFRIDHVHLWLALSPTVAPAALINNLKTVSAMTLRREFPLKLNRHFWRFKGLWSRSYCAISCGGAPLEVLKHYIENQDRPLS